MASYKYVITSGWWCGVDPDEARVRFGSESIREVSFFKKWKDSVLENTSPLKIMVLDSNSDIKPAEPDLVDVEFISINENPGHSTNHRGHYSGYMRSIIAGVNYAALCDADYWVYVEQDALLKGRGIVEYCITNMDKPYMFGHHKGTYQLLQQSFIIIRKDGFYPFLENMHKIKAKDKDISPETKFLLATSRLYRLLPEYFYKQLEKNNLFGRYFRKSLKVSLPFLKGFDYLPFGYGRTRPINFDEDYFYFQHGNEAELNEYEHLK